MPIASILRAVSRSVSPFFVLEVEAEKFTTLAPSRFSASSNDVRVRVLGSKNRFTTVWPLRSSRGGALRVATSRKASAASSTWVISSAE